MKLASYLVVIVLLTVGLVSFVYVRSKQSSGDVLVAAQRQAQALTAAAVASVVKAAPEPTTNARGHSARCVALGHGELRNPWRCVISYPSGRRIQYTVRLRVGGSYVGSDQVVDYQGRTFSAAGEITGCCVAVP
jgi:hypothetical protein